MPLHVKTLDETRWIESYAQRCQSNTVAAADEGDTDGIPEAMERGRAIIATLQTAILHRAECMKEHQQARMQQRLASKQKDFDRKAWHERIAGLKQSEERAERALQQTVESLPNYVDEAVIQDFTRVKPYKASFKVPSTVALDHNLLFEMRVYERVNDKMVVWTQQGRRLGHALMQYILQNVTQQYSNLSVHEMPYVMPPQVDKRQPADTGALLEQSWKTLASSGLVARQAFLDRQLPRLYAITGTIQLNEKGQQTLEESREPYMWHHQLAADQYMNILATAGPSLVADSRPLQIQLVQQFQHMFQQLLSNHEHAEQTSASVAWETVALPPTSLRPHESSCLCLRVLYAEQDRKCHTKQSKAAHTERKTITVVSVSNLESYESEHLKHASTAEPLHLVLVQMAPLATIIDWIVNVTKSHGSSDCGVWLAPVALRQWLVDGNNYRFQVVRKMVMGKNGKRSIQQASTPNFTQHAETSLAVLGEASVGELTDDQIRGEAMSCPFDFLPFHT